MDQSITLEEFENLLLQDELADETMVLINTIFTELRPHITSFQANSHELVQLSSFHSPTFSSLTADRQQFLCGIMTMPVFFYSVPEGNDEL